MPPKKVVADASIDDSSIYVRKPLDFTPSASDNEGETMNEDQDKKKNYPRSIILEKLLEPFEENDVSNEKWDDGNSGIYTDPDFDICDFPKHIIENLESSEYQYKRIIDFLYPDGIPENSEEETAPPDEKKGGKGKGAPPAPTEPIELEDKEATESGAPLPRIFIPQGEDEKMIPTVPGGQLLLRPLATKAINKHKRRPSLAEVAPPSDSILEENSLSSAHLETESKILEGKETIEEDSSVEILEDEKDKTQLDNSIETVDAKDIENKSTFMESGDGSVHEEVKITIDEISASVYESLLTFSKHLNCTTLHRCIYPQTSSGVPVYNPNGKYIVKLFVGGKYRKIYVDDRIPLTSQNERCLAASSNSFELWPTLLSKALYKLYKLTCFQSPGVIDMRDNFSSYIDFLSMSVVALSACPLNILKNASTQSDNDATLNDMPKDKSGENSSRIKTYFEKEGLLIENVKAISVAQAPWQKVMPLPNRGKLIRRKKNKRPSIYLDQVAEAAEKHMNKIDRISATLSAPREKLFFACFLDNGTPVMKPIFAMAKTEIKNEEKAESEIKYLTSFRVTPAEEFAEVETEEQEDGSTVERVPHKKLNKDSSLYFAKGEGDWINFDNIFDEKWTLFSVSTPSTLPSSVYIEDFHWTIASPKEESEGDTESSNNKVTLPPSDKLPLMMVVKPLSPSDDDTNDSKPSSTIIDIKIIKDRIDTNIEKHFTHEDLQLEHWRDYEKISVEIEEIPLPLISAASKATEEGIDSKIIYSAAIPCIDDMILYNSLPSLTLSSCENPRLMKLHINAPLGASFAFHSNTEINIVDPINITSPDLGLSNISVIETEGDLIALPVDSWRVVKRQSYQIKDVDDHINVMLSLHVSYPLKESVRLITVEEDSTKTEDQIVEREWPLLKTGTTVWTKGKTYTVLILQNFLNGEKEQNSMSSAGTWKLSIMSDKTLPDPIFTEPFLSHRKYAGFYTPNKHLRLFKDVFSLGQSTSSTSYAPIAMRLSSSEPTFLRVLVKNSTDGTLIRDVSGQSPLRLHSLLPVYLYQNEPSNSTYIVEVLLDERNMQIRSDNYDSVRPYYFDSTNVKDEDTSDNKLMWSMNIETNEDLNISADLQEIENKNKIKEIWEKEQEGRAAHAAGAYTLYGKKKQLEGDSEHENTEDLASAEKRTELLGNFLHLETEQRRQSKRDAISSDNSLKILNERLGPETNEEPAVLSPEEAASRSSASKVEVENSKLAVQAMFDGLEKSTSKYHTELKSMAKIIQTKYRDAYESCKESVWQKREELRVDLIRIAEEEEAEKIRLEQEAEAQREQEESQTA